MNERDRFRRLFRGESVDRPPLLEEGVRDEVVELWRAQGMPAGRSHCEIFGLTPHENVGPDITFLSEYSGRIMSLSATEYRRAFNASHERFPDDWHTTANRLHKRDHIAGVWAYRGFFQAMGVDDWPTLRQALHAVVKDPRRVLDRMRMYGDFCARMLEMALRDVAPEFVYLSEPISDNKGPLISPAMFEEFVLPAYARIIAVAREHGCENVLLSTYGNSAALFQLVFSAGVTMLWISEAAEDPALDYRNLRKRYGTGLGLIGGIPLSILRSESPDRMKGRLREIVVPLMKSGRYIPLAGGRVREDISWEPYKRYRQALIELIASSFGSPANPRCTRQSPSRL